MTRTFVPVTSFVSSPETEKDRVLYAVESVATGFYPRHGFLTLPTAIPRYKSYCIVIPPDLRTVSPSFWADALRGGVQMPKIISPLMRKEVANLNFEPVDKLSVFQFESKWKRIEKEVWTAIKEIFPKEIKWIKSLEVRLTNFGPLGSHFLLTKKTGQHLIIYLRYDGNVYEILNLLVLSLIYPYEKEFGLSFTHRQTLRNFILSRPQFKKIYPGFSPKTFDNPKIPISLKIKSEEYVRYLGIPNPTNPFAEVNKNIDKFGAKESIVLQELIKKQGEIVSYDEIADSVWGAGEFKSYWAINKLIQRIQKKIDVLNINLKIKGVRGRGYKI